MNPFDSINQSILRDIEEMQRISDSIGRDWQRMVEMIPNIDFERIAKLSEEQWRAIELLEGQSRGLSGLTFASATHSRMIKDVLRAGGPTMLSLTNASILAANAALADARWLDSRLAELWTHIPERGQEFTDERVETDLKALNEFIRAAMERTRPKTRPNFFNIMSLILAVYFFYSASGEQQEMETRVTAMIEESRTAIIEEFKKQFRVLEPERDHAWFIVEREVSPRRGRRGRSQIVGKLYRGQLVSVIKDRGRKLKIAYFDLQAEEPREGWVLKKYLKRVITQSNHEIVLPE